MIVTQSMPSESVGFSDHAEVARRCPLVKTLPPVTPTPSRNRPNRFRAARCPSIVHGSREASIFDISLAAPRYCGVAIARGIKEFRWSGTHNESMRLTRAVR